MASNFWNFRGQAPVNTEEAARAAYVARQKANMQGYTQPGMDGYVPSQDVPGLTPGVVTYTQPERQINQQGGFRSPTGLGMVNTGTGMAYTEEQERIKALQDEYERNNARIAEIEQELKTIATSDRQALDDIDLALAQNRAGIGDIGNAYLHLSRIDQRRAVDLGKSANADTDRNAAEDEIDRLYIQRGDASPAQQVYIDRAIARKEAAYQKLYGKPYGGKLEVPTGAQAASEVTTFQGYDDVLQQELQANGGNGRLSKAQISKLNAILDKLPSGNERNERKKALDAVKSNEKHDEDVAKQKAKEKAAIAEVKPDVTGRGLNQTGDSKSVVAKNGLTVTVTRMSDGSIQYKCGSTKE